MTKKTDTTTNEATTTENKQADLTPAANTAAVRHATWHTYMAAIATVLAVAAWVVLSINGYAALALGSASFAAACLGLRAHTRSWRNLATTALIASAVIMVVLAAFLIVIFWGLNSI